MLQGQGLTEVGWDIDSQDWLKRASVDSVLSRVGREHGGTVILMHDGVDASYRLGGIRTRALRWKEARRWRH